MKKFVFDMNRFLDEHQFYDEMSHNIVQCGDKKEGNISIIYGKDIYDAAKILGARLSDYLINELYEIDKDGRCVNYEVDTDGIATPMK